ncbi:MAG TPA: YggT family protein [Patescibacteria group bacterium]|nr:YggT family protein [Patescibacteria group bacterium]
MENQGYQSTTTIRPQPTHVIRTTRTVEPVIRTESPQVAYQKKKALFRSYQIIWYVLGLIEAVLVLRILLKVLAANPAAGFTSFIYALSAPFAVPFQGILRTDFTSGSVFEWSTVLAAVVYFLVAIGLVNLLQLFKPTDPEEVSSTVDGQ